MPKPLDVISFRFDPDIREALDTIKARDGIALNEQLRRACLLWIEHRKLLHDITTTGLAAHAANARRRAK